MVSLRTALVNKEAKLRELILQGQLGLDRVTNILNNTPVDISNCTGNWEKRRGEERERRGEERRGRRGEERRGEERRGEERRGEERRGEGWWAVKERKKKRGFFLERGGGSQQHGYEDGSCS